MRTLLMVVLVPLFLAYAAGMLTALLLPPLSWWLDRRVKG